MTIRRPGRQTERCSTSFLLGLQLWRRTSRNARALHGPPRQKKASLPKHKATATKHKKFGNFVSRCRTFREYLRLSASRTNSFGSDVLPGWSSDQWRSWKINWWDGAGWTSSASTGNWWNDATSSWDSWQGPFHWATSHPSPRRKWDITEAPQFSRVRCKLIDVEDALMSSVFLVPLAATAWRGFSRPFVRQGMPPVHFWWSQPSGSCAMAPALRADSTKVTEVHGVSCRLGCADQLGCLGHSNRCPPLAAHFLNCPSCERDVSGSLIMHPGPWPSRSSVPRVWRLVSLTSAVAVCRGSCRSRFALCGWFGVTQE